jgi:cell fate regulator YaaT (PSP1 superfamily)
MNEKILIKARSDNKVYLVDRGNIELDADELVIFESDQCQEVAKVIKENDQVEEPEEKDKDDKPAELIRRMNEKDNQIDEDNRAQARQCISKCQEIIVKHKLPMELLDADLSFDGRKLTFYFTAPGRVDFRTLVSELASTFQKLIRLQQVGARDRARCSGGVGRCGQHFCCNRFLKGELECVSIDMAYDQNIGQMGSNRVTGACGKLMCCLRYELEFYQKAKKKMPAIGSTIKTPKGEGTVVGQRILKNKVVVELSDKTYVEVDC